MCAEAVPWRCHRSMIGDALVKKKWLVNYIMSLKKAPPHRLTSFLKVKKGIIVYPPEVESQLGFFIGISFKSSGVPISAFECTTPIQTALCFMKSQLGPCLLYTSDAADERSSVDLGGRRIIKKKKKQRTKKITKKKKRDRLQICQDQKTCTPHSRYSTQQN